MAKNVYRQGKKSVSISASGALNVKLEDIDSRNSHCRHYFIERFKLCMNNLFGFQKPFSPRFFP